MPNIHFSEFGCYSQDTVGDYLATCKNLGENIRRQLK